MRELGLTAWAPQFILGVGEKAKVNALKIVLLGLLAYLVMSRDIAISFSIGPGQEAGNQENKAEKTKNNAGPEQRFSILPVSLKTSNVSDRNEGRAINTTNSTSYKEDKKDLRANTFSNLGFIMNPGYAKKHNIDPEIVGEKLAICKAYVDRYSQVAQQEMEKFGIPASITLAQGLLESNAGDSKLSRESNNHFGIKCRSKCRACTCRNYTDDNIYDMFRVFDTPWQSFREHSKLLASARYRHLINLDRQDYKAWAYGLKRAGYATDKRYAEKLIRLIETLGLDEYDH